MNASFSGVSRGTRAQDSNMFARFSRFSPSSNHGPRSLTSVQVSREWLETRTKESKHMCKFLGSLTRLEPTAIGGRHRRQQGWTCPQLSCLWYGPRSPTGVYTCSARECLYLRTPDNRP